MYRAFELEPGEEVWGESPSAQAEETNIITDAGSKYHDVIDKKNYKSIGHVYKLNTDSESEISLIGHKMSDEEEETHLDPNLERWEQMFEDGDVFGKSDEGAIDFFLEKLK